MDTGRETDGCEGLVWGIGRALVWGSKFCRATSSELCGPLVKGGAAGAGERGLGGKGQGRAEK